jgi:Zn-dependent protease
MHSWRNFTDKVRRYFPLEATEKRGFIISIILLGFIFSFRNWGTEKFDWALGIQNFIITIILVAVAFATRELAHRTIAVWLGYRTQYKAWLLGLVIGLVVAFVSNGSLLFIAPGLMIITHLEVHRLGKGFYALSYKHLGWIAMSGPIANMLFAVLMKTLAVATGIEIFQKAMMISIWIALFDMVPVPPFNGSRTFFGSRFIYVFVLGALIGCAALLAYTSGILAILGAIVLGALMLLVFFVYIDKRW